MTTLIAVYNSRRCIGRCDANCYEAKTEKCTCICRGMNHRAGRTQALKNNEEQIGLTGDDLKKFAELHGHDPKDLHVIDRVAEPNARRARKKAKLAIMQPELPFTTQKESI